MAIKDVVLGYAKGDKGDRGPQGEKGATGAIGPKGDPGNIADAQITDTEGLDVAKGQKTTAQKLFDAIANRIVTKLVTNDALTKKLADYMLKGMMSNTNVNNTGTVPTSALMYSMFEQINNNISNFKTFYGISWREYENISLAIESKLRDKVYANGMYFFMAYTKGGSVSMIILSVGIDVSFGIWFNYAGNGKQFKFMNDNYQEYPFISQGIELAGADSAWITKHGMPAGQPPGSR